MKKVLFLCSMLGTFGGMNDAFCGWKDILYAGSELAKKGASVGKAVAIQAGKGIQNGGRFVKIFAEEAYAKRQIINKVHNNMPLTMGKLIMIPGQTPQEKFQKLFDDEHCLLNQLTCQAIATKMGFSLSHLGETNNISYRGFCKNLNQDNISIIPDGLGKRLQQKLTFGTLIRSFVQSLQQNQGDIGRTLPIYYTIYQGIIGARANAFEKKNIFSRVFLGIVNKKPEQRSVELPCGSLSKVLEVGALAVKKLEEKNKKAVEIYKNDLKAQNSSISASQANVPQEKKAPPVPPRKHVSGGVKLPGMIHQVL